MDQKEQLFQIETELDDAVKHLKLWELPFQTVLSCLLLTIDSVDKSKGTDTAMDYCSRLSYVYNLVKTLSAKVAINSSTNAILALRPEDAHSLKFLNSYAHFSLLIPQVRRNVMKPSKIEGKYIELEYSSEEAEFAELIDRLYSYLSLQMMVSYKGEEELKVYLKEKAAAKDLTINATDEAWLKHMFLSFKEYLITVEVLPSSIMTEILGFGYNGYLTFTATIRAFAEFHLHLGSAYLSLAQKERDNNVELADELMSEYFENVVNCFDLQFVDLYVSISGLSKDKIMGLLSYYMTIYSNNLGDAIEEKSFCDEGFFPPFCLFGNYLISSPHSSRYMLPINNILYSINKKQPKFFNDRISSHLEPTLINQLAYLFKTLNSNFRSAKNVSYPGGEADLLVISEIENTCLAIQVKSTIAPDSSRTVKRVQDRALEGINQIEHFRSIPKEDKQRIVNHRFGVKLSETSFIDLLLVRSSAGTELIWKHNSHIRIINYCFLAWIISEKIKEGDFTLSNLNDLIKDFQENLIKLSKWQKVYENVIIGDYTIKFPNINIDVSEIVPINFRTYLQLPDFEKSHSEA